MYDRGEIIGKFRNFKYCGESVCGSDLFISFTLSSIDSCCNGGDSSNSVLSFFGLDDGNVGGMDGELVGCSVGFVFGDFVDMDSPFLSENLDNFSFGSFSCSSEDHNFVVFADW